MKSLAVVGGGSWGTALSIILAPRFEQTRLWIHDPQLADSVSAGRENAVYLPGFPLPAAVNVSSSLGYCLDGADVVLTVVPSHVLRAVCEQIRPFFRRGMLLVSATKGIENGTLFRMSQVISDSLARNPGQQEAVVLSGPSFAREVAAGLPTALVAAAANPDDARTVQRLFSGAMLRIYTSNDPLGVELGGAFKNVVAIGAGVCDGLSLGHNAVAALITRGLAEMKRLAEAMGAQAATLSGLAGLGDMVLTCTGDLSRNRKLGIQLAEGRMVSDVLRGQKMVVEGVNTAGAILSLGQLHGVDLPIVSQMNSVLSSESSPRQAIRELMERSLREE